MDESKAGLHIRSAEGLQEFPERERDEQTEQWGRRGETEDKWNDLRERRRTAMELHPTAKHLSRDERFEKCACVNSCVSCGMCKHILPGLILVTPKYECAAKDHAKQFHIFGTRFLLQLADLKHSKLSQ